MREAITTLTVLLGMVQFTLQMTSQEELFNLPWKSYEECLCSIYISVLINIYVNAYVFVIVNTYISVIKPVYVNCYLNVFISIFNVV